MSRPIRILHLEDNPADAELIREIIAHQEVDCQIELVSNRANFESALASGNYDVVLCDYGLPSYTGLQALSLVRKTEPDLPFILLSGTLGEEQAVNALKTGANDYILKNRLSRLGPAIVRAVQEYKEKLERRRADEQLRRQAQLLDQTHDAIYVCTIDQEIEFWNAGAERLYGWLRSEVIGKRADEVFYQDAEQVLATQAVLEKGEWVGEVKQVTKSGRQIVVASRRALLRDAAGKPSGILTTNTDITEQKKLETQFLQAQRMECVGSLAGGIAHDLNNMLAPILMAADMIRPQLSDPEDAQIVDLITSSASRGADLVKQILAFSKGATSLRGVFNPRHIIADIEKVLRATLPKEIVIRSYCQKDLLPVEGDATQIHQVLMNLCINARDAMNRGGELRLSAGNQPEVNGKPSVWIKVEDTGTGIPEELIDRIFDPFFTTKDPGKGTGLGLATVKKIISAHGGRIEVSSKPGQGSTFTFYLPASAGSAVPEQPRHDTVPRGRGEAVLVVDDEAALREIIKTTLDTFGYVVEAAPNGIEALGLLRKKPFQIVLTDMSMPGMGGADFVREAAALKPGELAFVIMSGVLEKSDLDALKDQPKTILQKPFSTVSLLKAVRDVVEKRT